MDLLQSARFCFRIPRPFVVSLCHCRKEEVLLSPDDGDDDGGNDDYEDGNDGDDDDCVKQLRRGDSRVANFEL